MAQASDNVSIRVDTVSEMECGSCGSVIDVSATRPFTEIECPACKVVITVPARLGPFYLIRLIGAGGMGAIFDGFDESLNRHVAVKVMLHSLCSDPKLIDDFKREAQMAAALNHPNVVQIYSAGEEKGQLYIAMELIRGRALDEMIEEAPLAEAFAVKLAHDIAKGLSAGFEIGLIHGDIKPKNILLDAKGTGKVVDFGLASFAGKQSVESGIWGTPYYIAPEKVLKQPVDARSDMYSLGATLYHAIAGTPPFDGKTAAAVVKARLAGPARPLDTVCENLTPETSQLVMRMLDEKPGRRHPTYASLIGDIEDLLKKIGPRSLRIALENTQALIAKKKSGKMQTGEINAAVKADEHPKAVVAKGAMTSRHKRLLTTPHAADPERKRHQRESRSLILLIVLPLLAILILTGGVVWAISFNAAKQREMRERNELVAQVENECGRIGQMIVALMERTRAAKEKVTEIVKKWNDEGNPEAAKVAADAHKSVDAAIQKADMLRRISVSALAVKDSSLSSATREEAQRRKYEMAALSAEFEGISRDIDALLKKGSEALARAHEARKEERPNLP